MKKKFLRNKEIISFVIPCYNCERFIERNIKKLINKLKNYKIKYEIILVNDSSKDNTKKILNKLKFSYNKLKVFNNKTNKGKSYSLIYGIKKTKGRKIIIYDCDLPYFKFLDKVIKKVFLYQLVLIDRRHKKSKLIVNKLSIYQILRFLIGHLIYLINSFFINIKTKDSQSGLKGFEKPKNFNKIKFISKRFFFDLELLIIFQKKKIYPYSIPVKFEIPSNSNIKIFDLKKNIEIINELTKIIKKYKN